MDFCSVVSVVPGLVSAALASTQRSSGAGREGSIGNKSTLSSAVEEANLQVCAKSESANSSVLTPFKAQYHRYANRVPALNNAFLTPVFATTTASSATQSPLCSANKRFPNTRVRHPPQSGWLDEFGRLKGGWSKSLGVARCAPHWLVQNCTPAPSAASCSRM